MFNKTRRCFFAAAADTPLMAGAAWAEGLITIIVTDPANPYWFTEGEVAKATAESSATRPRSAPTRATPTPRAPDRHRDHQQVGGDHPRPGQRRRLGRRGQEGGRCRHPGAPRQRRDQPGRPGQGAARLQQRPGRRNRRAAMGRERSATRATMSSSSATRPTTTPQRARTATRRC